MTLPPGLKPEDADSKCPRCGEALELKHETIRNIAEAHERRLVCKSCGQEVAEIYANRRTRDAIDRKRRGKRWKPWRN